MIKTYKEYKQLAILKSIDKDKMLSFDKIDDRYYYVYRITNKETNKHYYGSRVSSNIPKKDLGIKYFTSSKSIKHIFKECPEKFKIKIIKIFKNNSDKGIYESYLHQYFDVKLHNRFYNKSNQTPFGFDTTGVKLNDAQLKALYKANKGKTISDEHKSIISKCNLGKVVTLKTRKLRSIAQIDYNKTHGNNFKGKTHSEEAKNIISEKRKLRVGYTQSKETKNKISESHKGNIRAIDIIDMKYIRLTKEYFNNNRDRYVSTSANIVKIYDNNKVLVYECIGNLSNVCKSNHLPYNAIMSSFRNKGKLIYTNLDAGNLVKLKKSNPNYINFIGWFALKTKVKDLING